MTTSRKAELSLAVLVPIGSVLMALLTVAALLVIVGADPVEAFRQMVSASLADSFALSTTITKAMPRLMAALGIALALRAGLWNIGAEGQIYIGALAATGVALYGPDLGFPWLAIVAVVAGAVAGGLYGAIPGILRATRGVSEVITSLMLVYIAVYLVAYMVEVPWKVPGLSYPASDQIPPAATLPILVPGTLLNAGVIVAILAVATAWIIDARSRFGWYLRAVGGNERGARFSGVPVKSVIIRAMALSGAFAGLAGAVEVLGTRGRLIEGFSPGYGFEAIAIALLGRLHPLGIVVAALLFGALDAGGAGLSTAARGVPSAIVQVAAGLSVVYVLVGMGAAEAYIRRRKTRDLIVAVHQGDGEGQPPATPEGALT